MADAADHFKVSKNVGDNFKPHVYLAERSFPMSAFLVTYCLEPILATPIYYSGGMALIFYSIFSPGLMRIAR
jgi:hypothetical protein